MREKNQNEKVRWHRNIPLDNRHLIDVFINPIDRFVAVEMFTPFSPRVIVFAYVYASPCDYLQKAIEKAAQVICRYDDWCRKGIISDCYE